MKVLGIETSCDETGVAVIEGDGRGPLKILANAVYSQIALHQQYGGVYPEAASREHVRKIGLVLEKAIEEATQFSVNPKSEIRNPKQIQNRKSKTRRGLGFGASDFEFTHQRWLKDNVDAIAVTAGPGLIGSLLVGVNAAKTLAYAFDKPIIGVNHHEGHIAAAWLDAGCWPAESGIWNLESGSERKIWSKSPRFKPQDSSSIPQFPAVALVVSGGHTMLVLMRAIGDYEILGRTRDDAAGEAFDKTARLLGLPYPGGPAISALAEKFRNSWSLTSLSLRGRLGDRGNLVDSKIRSPRLRPRDDQYSKEKITIPRPMLDSGDLTFSFSGLKTAVARWVELNKPLTIDKKILLAYEIQEAIIEVLVTKTLKAVEQYKPKSVIVSGGVAANHRLREAIAEGLRDQTHQLNLHSSFEIRHSRPPSLHIPPPSLCTDNAAMIGAAGLLKALAGQVQNWYDIQANDKMSLANDE